MFHQSNIDNEYKYLKQQQQQQQATKERICQLFDEQAVCVCVSVCTHGADIYCL